MGPHSDDDESSLISDDTQLIRDSKLFLTIRKQRKKGVDIDEFEQLLIAKIKQRLERISMRRIKMTMATQFSTFQLKRAINKL